MTDLATQLANIACLAFEATIKPDGKNAFYDVRVERTGIAIEAKWGKAMNYRHITSWRELEARPDVLEHAFGMVKNIVENET